jgi:hypothetical protein
MTALQQHRLEDMQLRGYSAGTQGLYLHAVRELAAYYGRSPDQIAEEERRRYLLYTDPASVAMATSAVALDDLWRNKQG